MTIKEHIKEGRKTTNETKYYFICFSYLLFALGIGTGLVVAAGSDVGSRAGLTGLVILLFALLLLFVITNEMQKREIQVHSSKKG